jgi:hypothetical protein
MKEILNFLLPGDYALKISLLDINEEGRLLGCSAV